MDIEYWEIWNEPDLDPDDSENKRTWGGTRAQFFEFYHIAATHLKSCFPHLKIGGPAIAEKLDWAEEFLKQLKAPLDFFSWHVYAHDIEKITTRAMRVRELLDKYGFEKSESILNEWNYVTAWDTDSLNYSHKMSQEIKGASFTLATMCQCQKIGVDMLMYYDARPCAWNGLFDFTQIGRVTTKAYNTFPMFDTLYKLGTEVCTDIVGEDIYALCAKNKNEAAIVFTYFNDDDSAPSKNVALDIGGLDSEKTLETYLLDKDNEIELIHKTTVFGGRVIIEQTVDNFSCYLIKIK